MKKKLIAIHNNVANATIREYSNIDGSRYFTASIFRWRNFKFISEVLTPSELLEATVILVRAFRDELKDVPSDKQHEIVKAYPTLFNLRHSKN